jgi:putative ATP-dependent endonuclease of OLD family
LGPDKATCTQLLEIGTAPQELFSQGLNAAGPAANLAAFNSYAVEDFAYMAKWTKWLLHFNVFFCVPLDLDYSMLCALPSACQIVEPDRHGPQRRPWWADYAACPPKRLAPARH